MKHETFNSIIAFLGLGLAAITAWHQFAPKSDAITLVSEGRVEVGRPLEIDPIGTIDHITGANQPVAGPITWKLRIHNPTDHAVSLVSFETYLLTEANRRIKYSTMRERLSPFQVELPVQHLPENIPPNESRAYLVSLFVPFSSDEDAQDQCEQAAESLRSLERCFFEKGRDMFGNRVQIVESGSELFAAQWTDEFEGPRFLVVLETADGSEFSTNLSFLPGL
ncbi:hypothetical protein [uncultured Tateyamaria sp.]|uniref:hypothetical protein n=1 Tax=uncultured Tateyamaria sp. TaxID=455651 RepID=UPI00260E6FDB|nr:hypothetical protein [uncultured Tateyamaria sp.]